MALSYQAVKETVHQKIKTAVFRQIFSFVSDKEPELWGAQQPAAFLRMNVYLCIYKDIVSIGCNNLALKAETWYPAKKNSLKHNIKVIRTLLGEWGLEQIKPGQLSDWNGAARNVSIGKEIRGVNLWIDSSDFRLKGRRSTSRKNSSWSYKMNSPAQRFMLISDGKMTPRFISDGYTPKLYDSDWIKANRSFLDGTFRGSTIVGDAHFRSAREHLQSITIHAPVSAVGRPKKGEKKTPRTLPAKILRYNAQIRRLRSRIESPFGVVKQMFKALDTPWLEEEAQQESLVYFAVGLVAVQKN